MTMPADDAAGRPTRRLWPWAVGGGLLTALLVAVQREIGWAEALAAWSRLPPASAGAALLLLLLSYATRAQRLRRHALRGCGSGFWPVFRLLSLHTALNNLLPMRSGEAAFPILMRRQFGVAYGESLAQLLWLRVLDLHWLLCLAMALLLPNGAAWAIAWSLLPMVASTARDPWLRRLEPARSRPGKALQTLLRTAPAGAVLAEAWLWSALSWLAKGAALLLLYRHFAGASPAQAASAILAAELTSVLPVNGIAGAGTYEAAAVAATRPLGLDSAPALLAALNAHLFLLCTSIVLALLSLRLPEKGPESQSRQPMET